MGVFIEAAMVNMELEVTMGLNRKVGMSEEIILSQTTCVAALRGGQNERAFIGCKSVKIYYV